MIRIDTMVVGQLKTNCYIVSDENDKAIVIDPGDDADFIINKLASLGKDPIEIIATHGHFDHNMASFELQQAYKIPFLISEKDLSLLKKISKSAKYFTKIKVVKAPKPDGFLKDKHKITFGNSFFEVIEVPGHTPGSVSFYNPQENIVFCGDLIFKDGSIGRYDFSYSSKNDLFDSVDKILKLPQKTIIYTGHGSVTNVKNERYFHR